MINECRLALVPLVVCLWTCKLKSQEVLPSCGSDKLFFSTLTPDIERRTKGLERPEIVKGFTRNDEIIHIPVVVHVLYSSSIENISDEQIFSQIAVLNDDFRKKNTITHSYPQAADAGIEFHLANLDPTGLPTTGIVRKFTQVTSFDINLSKSLDIKPNINMKVDSLGGSTAWPSDKYLNIWVVNMQDYYKGFATFPLTVPAHFDGVVMNYEFFGKTGTGTKNPNFSLGRSCTHEVGHWLNLKHIWGDKIDCSSSDMVEDTPPQRGYHTGCPKGINTCGQTDMVENFMDYSYDTCLELFTAGQKQRMRNLFLPGGPRHSFLQQMAYIGDKLWFDSNKDGLQNLNEYGVSGIAVTLHSPDGNLMAADTTDLSGHYKLSYAGAGTFFIKYNLPAYLTSTVVNDSSQSMNSDINNTNGLNTTSLFTLSPGMTLMDVDGGVVNSQVLAISDLRTGVNVNGNTATIEWTYTAEEKVQEAKVYVAFSNGANEVFDYQSLVDQNTGQITIPGLLDGIHYYQIKLFFDDNTNLMSHPLEIKIGHEPEKLKIFPSPAHDLIEINLPLIVKENFSFFDIDIFDSVGKSVRKMRLSTDETRFDVSDLRQGMFAVALNVNGTYYSGHFIKM